jgi:hypothetical protein
MKAVSAGAALLLLGGLAGWMLRGWRDQAHLREISAQAFMMRMMADPQNRMQRYVIKHDPEEPPTPEQRDADLRCILYDPEAIAAPATIRDVTRTGSAIDGWSYDLELDTPKGAFRARWAGEGVPEVGRKRELFGRPAAAQMAGVPTRLEPAWLEPAGTMARLDKRPPAAR